MVLSVFLIVCVAVTCFLLGAAAATYFLEYWK